MFASILLAGLLADPLPPIEASDRFRFGCLSRELTLREWGFMSRHCVWAVERQQWRLEPTFPWDLWLSHAHHCRRCWDALDDVYLAFDDERRIKHLQRLRDLLGPANYYAGVMPLTQPFRTLEAELLPPWTPPPAPAEDLDVPPPSID